MAVIIIIILIHLLDLSIFSRRRERIKLTLSFFTRRRRRLSRCQEKKRTTAINHTTVTTQTLSLLTKILKRPSGYHSYNFILSAVECQPYIFFEEKKTRDAITFFFSKVAVAWKGEKKGHLQKIQLLWNQWLLCGSTKCQWIYLSTLSFCSWYSQQ